MTSTLFTNFNFAEREGFKPPDPRLAGRLISSQLQSFTLPSLQKKKLTQGWFAPFLHYAFTIP